MEGRIAVRNDSVNRLEAVQPAGRGFAVTFPGAVDVRLHQRLTVFIAEGFENVDFGTARTDAPAGDFRVVRAGTLEPECAPEAALRRVGADAADFKIAAAEAFVGADHAAVPAEAVFAVAVSLTDDQMAILN